MIQTTMATSESRLQAYGTTPVEAITSLAGAAGIALLVPVAILLAGLPIVLVIRGLLEFLLWLLPGLR